MVFAAVIAILIIAGSQWFFNPTQLNNIPVVNSSQQNTQNNQEDNTIITSSNQDKNPLNESSISNKNKTISNKPKSSIAQNTNSNSLSNKANKNIISKTQQDERKNKSLKANSTSTDEALAYSNFSSKGSIQKSTTIDASTIQNPIIKKVASPKKSLVEVAENLNNEDELKISNSEKNAWFIKPQISPIFYGNLGSGSAVDPNFAQNNGQGEVNMSYGINVAYQINDKIKLRTGVNRVNLNYTTNDVFLVPNQGTANLNNVKTNPNFTASVLNRQQLQNLSTNGNFNRSETVPSELQQELGYIEFPMEIEYKVLDRKIDINLIGGASTLLLNNNNLDVKNQNGTTSLGEANNINNLSFSTNFAIGLEYNFTERFMFNFEPTFKYQINTFQSGTTDFQPYFLGVYSGIVFKF
ncbi:hypothetical protein [Flavobacterium sp. CS20]|uniref:hypothetical protein n=1 Tax=Flavobacterium sp. CS20 TaxID=2775246 RepID=UPI001B3A6194|nr:hypothetical protein [Flavobacterium sp. CS20]QTY26477.1 hypothetical protein IGB25_11185 [Flavobacterium sp. CS20]